MGCLRLTDQIFMNPLKVVHKRTDNFLFLGQEQKQTTSNFCVRKYQYKYNGKEFQDELNLNLYDFHARNYDPTTGRTTTMDPLAEQYYSASPYSLFNNNPVYFIDPTGMAGEDFIDINKKTGGIKITKAEGNDQVRLVDNGKVVDSYEYGENGSFTKENQVTYENTVEGAGFNSIKGTPQTRVSFGDADKANTFFEFAAQSNVEFGLMTFFDSNTASEFTEVITNHSRKTVSMTTYAERILSQDDGVYLMEHRHNHPSGSDWPSGYNPDLTRNNGDGDRPAFKYLKDNFKSQINTKGEVFIPGKGTKPSISVIYDDKTAVRK